MLTLCAYYEGDVPEADRRRFDDHVRNVHLPLVARYPGLHSLRCHRGTAWNGAGPDHYLAFELGFASRADFDRAMASDIRRQAREDVGNFLPLFRGTVRHVLHQTDDIPVSG
ncbi:EthD family reductase [Albidovulum sp.]|uniref:EthD family reductase n=1 Tax=Albidovulum sp. TaxID=1872424 RepID=UPI0039B97F7E